MKIKLLSKIKSNLQKNKKLQVGYGLVKKYRYSFQGLAVLLCFLITIYFIILSFNQLEAILGWPNNVIISIFAGFSVNLVLIWIILSFILEFKKCDFFDLGSLGVYNLLLLSIISAFYCNYGIWVGVLFTLGTLGETFAIWYRIIGYRKIEKWIESRNRANY